MNIPSSIEEEYILGSTRAHRRALGQVFTPIAVADFMADWVCAGGPRVVTDPAFGTGVLARAIWRRDPGVTVQGFEIDPAIHAVARRQNYANLNLALGDYLTAAAGQTDGFIANPPYIRHRNLTGQHQTRAAISALAGYEIPKSANLYLYFCTKLIAELRPGCRGAAIIPGEWMNANFSHGFKTFLTESNALRHLIALSSCATIFDGALTTASILLLERPA